MADVYKIGVSIAMQNNASAILGVIAKDVLGLEKSVSKLTGGFSAAKIAIGGLAAAMAGGAMLAVMGKLVDKGIAFNQELAKMKMANFAPGDIASIEAQAYKTMSAVPGTNLVDAMKALVDLRNVSGSAEHAVELSEAIAKVNNVLHNITGKPAEEAGFKFIKFLEDSGRMMDKQGQFSVAKVEQQARWMEAVIAATNGRVNGDALFQLRQSGKASVNSLSDQGLTNLIPAIMSIGPVATGTAIQGMTQQLLGAVQLSAHTIGWLKEYGMVDPKKVHKEKGGRYSLSPGAITGEDTLQHDPAKWIWDVLGPHLKHKDGSAMSIEEQVDAVKRSALRSPAQGLITESLQNRTTQIKEVGNIERANQVDQHAIMDKESPTFRITKFTEAWNNLQISLGKTVDATHFLTPLTEAMNKFSTWAVSHPELVKYIMEVTAGFAVLAIGLGAFAIGGAAAAAMGVLAGPAGLLFVAAGLVALAAAIPVMFPETVHALAAALNQVPGAVDVAKAAILNLLTFGISGAVDGVKALLDAKLPKLPGVLGGDGGKPGASPNAPWSGRTYGPHGNTNPDGTERHSLLFPPRNNPMNSYNSQPMRVTVINPGDIGRSMTSGFADGASRPMSGPSFHDYRDTLPAPGFGNLA